MSDKWRVTMELWPYSGHRQEEVGPREVTFIVGGDTIRDALKQAHIFQSGALTNWRVWQAPITSIVPCDNQHEKVGEWKGRTIIDGKEIKDRNGDRHVEMIR